ncbi:MAG: response regulator transcription factor [Bacteroidetes bacterium]|nr:response regulator transcription factor [Bacteroidota bacterium]
MSETELKNKILIVDDEDDIIEFIKYLLLKESFIVDSAKNGIEAIRKAKIFKPDLILMDVMMPQLDGIEACRQIKSNPEFDKISVVFLTARSEEFSELAGFDAGAEDYIYKPIKPRALISRLKVILKRNKPNENELSLIKISDFEIDKSTYSVSVKGDKIFLPKKEFDLLYLLASKPNIIFNRDKILAAVWGDEVIVGDRTIDVHIRKIREKIGESYISTIKGIGYKFVI